MKVCRLPELEVVYNGVDMESSPSDPCNRASVRAEFGVSDRECLVLQVARLDAIKDHKTALRAHGVSHAIASRTCVYSSWETAPSEPPFNKRLRIIRSATVWQCWEPRRDVPRLLAAADVFLLTSVSEGIPVTILEAMAAGVPVVATNVGGVPELLNDRVTGLLAPAGDAASLADALLRLAGDPVLRGQFAEQARRHAESEFSESRMITEIRQYFPGDARYPRSGGLMQMPSSETLC